MFCVLLCPLLLAGQTDELYVRGQSRVYAGKYLDAISMPLGGIGSGGVQINGKAQLQSWQIFNNYDPLIPRDAKNSATPCAGHRRTLPGQVISRRVDLE